ncbi:MAG: EscU/YscU/HrcU family type III secretion system export apparatus switch protein [Deltaproteobacteria bacterium]|nr:EscU/YscU/HrcU family type III secretion system export apparatus switch protein [Deltaproteobacteria bacterium]
MNEDSAPHLPKRREHAVALQYLEKDELPKVIATGAGEIAREILEIAREHQIPIEEDSTLTDLLSKVNVGSAISPESFRLVAEVICFLYHSDLEFKKKHADLAPVLE